jgi:hypothetical protein
MDLVAADRARVQHAEQPLLMQPVEQRRREAAAALDLVGGIGDRGGEAAGARNGIGDGDVVHEPGDLPLVRNSRTSALTRCGCSTSGR